MLANIMQMMRDKINITIAITWEVRYLPFNGAMVIIVHRDFDQHFHGYTIYGYHTIFIIWKTMRTGEKY